MTNMREINAEEMRKLQLQTLDRVHDFCKKHNIRYSISGGTMLGAVRHGGFIPWDDDIDILLPRPDYERLRKTFADERYVFQDYKTDSNDFLALGRIYDNSTLVIGANGIITGVFIDVFPIDGVPEKENLPDYYRGYLKLYLQLCAKTTTFSCTGSWMDKIKNRIRLLLPKSRNAVITQLDKYFSQHSFETSKYVGSLTGVYPLKEHFDRSVFESYKEYKFEDRIYMGLVDYDTYLRTLFGNYMQLPPKDKQVSHHDFTAYWKD